MTRIASSRPQPAPAKKADPRRDVRRADEFRETVESIAVAIILALLVRAFAVEAFVIPTGSMAPTLTGRHKDVACPQCGQLYPINAHEETEPVFAGRGRPPIWPRVRSGLCSNCRFPAPVADLPSFKGDRILVMKFPYSLAGLPGAGGPRRWDVVVFNYPEIPEQNYIKRLVGLPDEELRVLAGDLLARPRASAPGAPFTIQRKPPHHRAAMQVLVYDDAHRPKLLAGKPEWLRWAPVADGAWKEGDGGTFVSAGQGGWAELRYRHLVPDLRQWEALGRGAIPETPPRATLITDFNSYNTGVLAERRDPADGLDPHWVGDLTLEFRLEVTTPRGRVRAELVRGGVPYRCEFEVATGKATLSRGGARLGEPVPCKINGPGTYDVAFANVDGRLTLTVDGAAPFGAGFAHDDGNAPRPVPNAADLAPAGVAAQGGAVRVSNLVLRRDIYYTLNPSQPDYGNLRAALHDRFVNGKPDGGALRARVETLLESAFDPGRRTTLAADVLADPALFPALAATESREFAIRPGHYMMMGDNSPRSKDGRAWTTLDQGPNGWDPNLRESNEVPASLLIGKAFFIYWPHGKPFWPNLRILPGLFPDVRIPFRPYFERMKWIR